MNLKKGAIYFIAWIADAYMYRRRLAAARRLKEAGWIFTAGDGQNTFAEVMGPRGHKRIINMYGGQIVMPKAYTPLTPEEQRDLRLAAPSYQFRAAMAVARAVNK